MCTSIPCHLQSGRQTEWGHWTPGLQGQGTDLPLPPPLPVLLAWDPGENTHSWAPVVLCRRYSKAVKRHSTVCDERANYWDKPGMEQVWARFESAQTVVPPAPPHFAAVLLRALGENIHPLSPMCACACVYVRNGGIISTWIELMCASVCLSV